MGIKPKVRQKFLSLEPFEQYQYRYALIQDYRAERTYQNIIACDLKPLWAVLPDIVTFNPFSSLKGESSYLTWSQCERHAYLDDDPSTSLEAYMAAVRRIVQERMRLKVGGGPAEWAAEFVHADVTAGEYGPIDPGVGLNYRTYEAALRLEVSPARARVRLVQPYAPDDSLLRPTSEEHEVASREVEAARWFSFDEWEQLEAQTFELYRLWVARMRQFWEDNYQYRYAGRMEDRREDIHWICAYLFKGEMIHITDRADRLRMQRMAKAIGIDLPKYAQKRQRK